MSKKTPLDILGSSNIPEDLLTPTMGSAFGLDSFPDMELGMGVLDAVLDPEYHESPALPTGLTKNGDGDGMDLTLMVEDSLSDLEWLDPTQMQDLDRLPQQTVDTVIPELEEAWGVNRRTNGIDVVSRDLNQVRYEEAAKQTGPAPRKATDTQVLTVVTQAMRRSAAGNSIETVVRQAFEVMGEEGERIVPFLKMVQANHGLAGNVFVRASAYPNYGQGKWAKHVKRYASGARYIVVSEAELKNATWIENGRCQYTSKLAVTEVPWADALAYYAPRLASTSRKVATNVGPREALRRAFLSPSERKAVETVFPTHNPLVRETYRAPKEALRNPVADHAAAHLAGVHAKVEQLAAQEMLTIHDRDLILASKVSAHEKLRVAARLASLPKEGSFSGSPNQAHAVNRQLLLARLDEGMVRSRENRDRWAKEAGERAEATVRNMADKGMFSEAARDRLLQSSAAPHEMLKAAAKLAVVRRKGYSGNHNASADATAGAIWDRLDRVNASVRGAQEVLDARKATYLKEGQDGINQRKHGRRINRIAEGVRRVKVAMEAGAQGSDLKRLIKRTFAAGDERLGIKMLAPLLSKTGALNPAPVKEYQGPKFTHKAHTRSTRIGALAKEARTAVRYVRKAMSEGFAGKDLTELVRGRFSPQVLEAAQGGIKEARDIHEGGAGFIYVDAEAYASPTGVKGCEEGALRHRANQIPAVATMDRCGTCTLARTLENGTRKCGVYNKLLMDDIHDPELKPLHEGNLKVADMHDAEHTASLFAPKFNPMEFGLQNANLEGVEMDEPHDYAELDISFGGWNL